MKKIRHSITYIIILFFACPCILPSQFVTSVKGIVSDSVSGEPMSFVSVVFEGSKSGTVTDGKGEFEILNKEGSDLLNVIFMGYESKQIKVHPGRSNKLKILLSPIDYQVDEIVISPEKETYKKNNSAVELVEKIIVNKYKNRIESNDYFQFEQYEKLSLSVTELAPEMQKKKVFDNLQFIFDYLDTSEINNNPILTVSVREILSDEYRRKSPQSRKSIVRATRHNGMDKKLESERLDALLAEAIKPVDIFDDHIELLFKRFISPLSTSRATSFYKYYLMDTVVFENEQCIDLAFTPYNNQDLGFTGNIWVSLDSTYSIRKVILKTPRNINLNFIAQMSISQEFEPLSNGRWAKAKESTAIEFSIFKIYYGLYAKNTRSFKNYVINQTSDLVFGFNDEVITIRNAEHQSDPAWEKYRHIPLKTGEARIDSLSSDFEKVPYFNTAFQIAQVLATNYIHTSGSNATSKFDIGPVGSIFSHNEVQGYRFRLGGRTTANLNDQLFFSGYGAYGTQDKKLMYSGSAVYSLYKKKYHENEYRKNNLGVLYQYDIYTPGQQNNQTSPDNFFLSFKRGEADKMSYLRQGNLWYEKEFSSGFYWKLSSKFREETAAGSLQFLKEDQAGNIYNVGKYKAGELGITLRYARNEKFHQGRDSRLVLKRDGPVFTITQNFGLKGYLGGEYQYSFTGLYAQKRFWIGEYGNLNLIGKAGKVWGEVPFPLLILPNANQSYTIQPESYSMMNTLEFINDRYVSWDATYEMGGWLFNRIPYIRKFKLREVASFKGLMGSLSDRNNPESNKNLFLFPENSYAMGRTPYMEASFGIENILKILRIDYVRRLTYLNNYDVDKNGFRLTASFSF